MQGRLQKEEVWAFIRAGHAILTVENEKTNRHKTFKIDRSKDGKVYFVRIRGDKDGDLKDRKNWIYIGLLKKNYFSRTKRSQVDVQSQSFQSFHWLNRVSLEWKRGVDRYPFVKVYHEGICGRCGRALTDPTSIEIGYGPECAKKI